MNQLNSFTSSSSDTTLRRVAAASYIAAWVVAGLITIDILINVLLAYPADPKVTSPSRLRLYFEYGRSTEGQLSRMTRVVNSGNGSGTASCQRGASACSGRMNQKTP